jgi:hypothetical protein
VPDRPDHPDREQLAAFQAGDGERRQRSEVEAHVAGCPSCAEVVASVERARGGLALLEEPALPPGLHDRLAAAVEAEAAQAAADLPAGRGRRQAKHGVTDLSTSRRRRQVASGAADMPASRGRETAPEILRPTPWYRRPVAWGAAAALLLAALVVPFLDQAGDDLTTAGGGSATGDAAQEARTPGVASAAGEVPVLRIPGEVSAAAVRSRLAADARAKAALDSAAARDSQGAPPAGQSLDQPGAEAYRSSAPPAEGAGASLEACLPAATTAAIPATRPLTPAFYIEGTYQGRPVTVLVTTSRGEPGRVDLWVFPRGDCSAAPLHTDRVS